jgi:hypothetical protein
MLHVALQLDTIAIVMHIAVHAYVGLVDTTHTCIDIAGGPWRTALIGVWDIEHFIILVPISRWSYLIESFGIATYDSTLFDVACEPLLKVGKLYYLFPLCTDIKHNERHQEYQN